MMSRRIRRGKLVAQINQLRGQGLNNQSVYETLQPLYANKWLLAQHIYGTTTPALSQKYQTHKTLLMGLMVILLLVNPIFYFGYALIPISLVLAYLLFEVVRSNGTIFIQAALITFTVEVPIIAKANNIVVSSPLIVVIALIFCLLIFLNFKMFPRSSNISISQSHQLN